MNAGMLERWRARPCEGGNGNWEERKRSGVDVGAERVVFKYGMDTSAD